jgi:hypothetical protein
LIETEEKTIVTVQVADRVSGVFRRYTAKTPMKEILENVRIEVERVREALGLPIEEEDEVSLLDVATKAKRNVIPESAKPLLYLEDVRNCAMDSYSIKGMSKYFKVGEGIIEYALEAGQIKIQPMKEGLNYEALSTEIIELLREKYHTSSNVEDLTLCEKTTRKVNPMARPVYLTNGGFRELYVLGCSVKNISDLTNVPEALVSKGFKLTGGIKRTPAKTSEMPNPSLTQIQEIINRTRFI